MSGVLSMNEDGKFVVNADTSNDEPKSISLARAFVMVINFLTFLGGMALAGVGVYVFIEFNARFSGLLSENAAIGAIVAGCILSVIACVGIFGVLHSNVKLLVLYDVVSLAILITILSVLGLFVEYINTVSQVASGNLTVMTRRQVEVNDFFASAYTKCCVQNEEYCFSKVPGAEGYCEPIQYCTNSTSNKICYAGDYGPTPNDPPKLVYQEFCGTLVAFKIAGVATTETGYCGAPEGALKFMKDVFNWVETNVLYPYICIGLLSAIIVVEIITTTYLARYLYLVGKGDWVSSPSRKKSAKTVNVESGHVSNRSNQIALSDAYRFEADEFDVSLKRGLSINQRIEDPDV